MNVVVDGLITNYQKVGSGKTLVCLHGWGANGKTYSELAKDLQKKYTLLILDLPGFGGTQSPPTAWGLDDYVKFIDNWLKKIGVNEVYAIIGHSFGGSLAITGVGQKRLQAQKIILLSAAGVRSTRTLRKQAIKMVAKSGKLPLRLLPTAQRRRLRLRFYRTVGSDMLLMPHMEETYRRIIKEDVRPAATKINMPTLLIYGSDDRQTPASDGRSLHRLIKGSQLEILPGDHFIHEQPQKVAGLVEGFLE